MNTLRQISTLFIFNQLVMLIKYELIVKDIN